MTTFDTIWNDIYGAGDQLNRYPFTSIVSFLYRHAPRDRPPESVRILELGCGAGNNIWFAAREGFTVTGLDASEAALNYARARFEAEGLEGRFVHGDFTDLPFQPESFEIVLERAALSQAPKPAARDAIAEVSRVLVPNGLMYAEIYSDRATSRGRPIDGGMLVDVEGPYSGVGQIAFYSKSELEHLFDGLLSIVNLKHTESTEVSSKPYEVYANWAITAQKG